MSDSNNIHVNIDNLNTDNTENINNTNSADININNSNSSDNVICINGINKDINALSEIDIKYLLDHADIDNKGNKIVPDVIFDKYYKSLPSGTRNSSLDKRAYNGGYMLDLSADNPKYKDIHRRGAASSNATQAQRRTFADTLKYMLRCPAKRAQIEALGLDEGATQQDAITAAMILQAADGNRGAAEFVRDTVGERPADVSDVSLHTISDADRSLIDKVRQRLDRAEEQEESGGENETE